MIRLCRPFAALAMGALALASIAVSAPLALSIMAQPTQAQGIDGLIRDLKRKGIRVGNKRYRVVPKEEARPAPAPETAVPVSVRPREKPAVAGLEENWEDRLPSGALQVSEAELGSWRAARVPAADIAEMAAEYRETGAAETPRGMVGRFVVAHQDYNAALAGDPALDEPGLRDVLQQAVNRGQISIDLARKILAGDYPTQRRLEMKLADVGVMHGLPEDTRLRLAGDHVECDGTGCDVLDAAAEHAAARAAIAEIAAGAAAMTLPEVAAAVREMVAAEAALAEARASVVPARTAALRPEMLANVEALTGASVVKPAPLRAPGQQGSGGSGSGLTLDEVLSEG